MPHAPWDQASWFFQFHFIGFWFPLSCAIILSLISPSFLPTLHWPHGPTHPLIHWPLLWLSLFIIKRYLSIYPTVLDFAPSIWYFFPLLLLLFWETSPSRCIALQLLSTVPRLTHPLLPPHLPTYIFPILFPLYVHLVNFFYIVGLQPSPLEVPWQNTAYSSLLALTAYQVYTVDGTPPPRPSSLRYIFTHDDYSPLDM